VLLPLEMNYIQNSRSRPKYLCPIFGP